MVYRITPSCIAPTRYTTVDRSNLTVIILAANIGYGMRSYGPKSLLAVNHQETILDHQISLVRSTFPKADIVLVVGFLADKIIKKCPSGIRIVENQLYENTNEANQLRLALNCSLTDSILVLKDDIVFNEETLKEISKDQSCIIYDSTQQLDEENIGVTVVDRHVTAFGFGLPDKWCHIAYLTGKELKHVRNLCNNRDNCRLYMFEILKLTLDKTEKMKAIEPKDMEIIKIDNSRDLDKLKV